MREAIYEVVSGLECQTFFKRKELGLREDWGAPMEVFAFNSYRGHWQPQNISRISTHIELQADGLKLEKEVRLTGCLLYYHCSPISKFCLKIPQEDQAILSHIKSLEKDASKIPIEGFSFRANDVDQLAVNVTLQNKHKATKGTNFIFHRSQSPYLLGFNLSIGERCGYNLNIGESLIKYIYTKLQSEFI